MIGERKARDVGGLIFLTALALVVACAVPSSGAYVKVLADGDPCDLAAIKDDYIDVYGTLNLLPGGYATTGLYVQAGATLNIYGCAAAQAGWQPVQVAAGATVTLFVDTVSTVAPAPTNGVIAAYSGTRTLSWYYGNASYSLNISTSSDITVEVVGEPQAIDVDVDVPCSLNINGHGLIPVHIFGTETFDVSAIDPVTLDFNGQAVRVKNNGSPPVADLNPIATLPHPPISTSL